MQRRALRIGVAHFRQINETAIVDDVEGLRRIGAVRHPHIDLAPSPEWFPQLVTPERYLEYWNDVDGAYRAVLARYWLTKGFESEQLRWLAGLTDRDAEQVTTEQILAVLTSLGVETESPSEFLNRCALALTQIQPDLDSTGFGSIGCSRRTRRADTTDCPPSTRRCRTETGGPPEPP